MSLESVITENLEIWTSAIKTKSASGRGSSNKLELYGIKKLRELILELAIRGKLVAQDSSEEPANELLKTIELNRLKLVKDKKIRKPKALPAIEESELPFPVPSSWSYVRLNSIGDWGAGSTPKRSISEYYGGGIPWFKSGELSADYIDASEETVTEKALEETSLRYNNIGDVLIAMYGATIGKTSILNVRGTTNQAVCACTPFEGVVNTYLLLLLKAYKIRFIGMGAGGAQPNISREKIISTVVPLPPQLEQKRIVSKVEELMTICDQLESQTESSIDAHKTLVETLLATLTNAKDADELNESWQRISEHFDTLFTTEDSIDQLKQTILQLAVMGKLVKQDSNDEPASALLGRIAKEKEQLIKDKKIKKQKALLPISEDEMPFELPVGWEWSRIGNASLRTDYGLSDKSSENIDGIPVLAMGQIQEGKVNLDVQKMVPSNVESLPELYLESRDLLYNRTNSAELVGKTGIYEGIDSSYTFASYLIRIRTLKDSLLPEFLNLNMQTPIFRKTQIVPHLKQQCGQANVNGTIMKSMIVAIAPEAEMRRIDHKLNQLINLCDNLKLKLQEAKLTQSYLADSISLSLVR
ncbi:restriction endonuclease subunit S [Pseudoalteromonas piscicida]|uniref:restriction endonuclease subunit S n=1 Tax=Pseudoalteromonas piscicida TaxID=43662 RepID=UPI0005FA1FEF|nr:restriction endonuclease subunit S [Pseudoalteromonas piscicida]KJZ02740.1 hypothetical protein TW73_11350 [Pseudoalteromonas piscicida]